MNALEGCGCAERRYRAPHRQGLEERGVRDADLQVGGDRPEHGAAAHDGVLGDPADDDDRHQDDEDQPQRVGLLRGHRGHLAVAEEQLGEGQEGEQADGDQDDDGDHPSGSSAHAGRPGRRDQRGPAHRVGEQRVTVGRADVDQRRHHDRRDDEEEHHPEPVDRVGSPVERQMRSTQGKTERSRGGGPECGGGSTGLVGSGWSLLTCGSSWVAPPRRRRGGDNLSSRRARAPRTRPARLREVIPGY